MANGNPFASPPPPAYGGAPVGPAAASNPFDPMAPPPQDPFSANNQPLLASSTSSAAAGAPSSAAAAPSSFAPAPASAAVAENPFGAPVSSAPTGSQQYGTATAAAAPQQSPFAAPPQPQAGLQQQQQQQHQQPYSHQAAYAPDGGAATSISYENNAIVVSQQQSNPYAGLVSPPQAAASAVPAADPYGQTAVQVVPSTQQSNQWALGGGAPAPAGSAASFDPFAPIPPPPPAPAPAVHPDPPAPVAPIPDDYVTSAPPQQQQQQPVQPAASPYPEQGDLGPFGESAPAPAPSHSEPEYQQQQHGGGPPDEPVVDHNRIDPPSYDYGQQKAPEPDRDPDGAGQRDARNPYREELARQAPPGASPLPKAELVRKKGYVLARISFRTIVMKKWKQTYWVQYGPHTMLWFRSESDFTDWLNNPYHDQAQRNFLIKLAVNFVHDLYKPNVRGYQVTQCRTKAYGNKMIRQFKLERWMDYGPTIAAAFGSYNPREVDDLRNALVECMRNTPLNSGIRATGAVRQRMEDQPRGEEGYEGDYGRGPPEDRPHPVDRPPHEDQNEHTPAAPESDGGQEEADLLDVENWDDVPKLPPAQQQQMASAAYGGAAVPPQQNGYGGAAAYGAEQSYPGQQAPQQLVAYQSSSMSQLYAQGQQPQQPYPGMAQQDPWASAGAPPPAGQPQYAASHPGQQQQYGAQPPQAQQYPTQQATY